MQHVAARAAGEGERVLARGARGAASEAARAPQPTAHAPGTGNTVSGAKRGNRGPSIHVKSGNRMVRLGLLWTISDLLVVAAGLARVERRYALSGELWGSSGAHVSVGFCIRNFRLRNPAPGWPVS